MVPDVVPAEVTVTVTPASTVTFPTTVVAKVKVELAENHNRSEHIIKYGKESPVMAHLIMHELVHIQLMHEARKVHENKLFITSPENRKAFYTNSISTLESLSKEGLSDEEIAKFADSLFDGLLNQLYNAPIDLFIENYLYNKYPILRPIQFLSLHKFVIEYIQIANNKSIIGYTPKFVRNANLILCMTVALQLNDLFAIETINAIEHPDAYRVSSCQSFP